MIKTIRCDWIYSARLVLLCVAAIEVSASGSASTPARNSPPLRRSMCDDVDSSAGLADWLHHISDVELCATTSDGFAHEKGIAQGDKHAASIHDLAGCISNATTATTVHTLDPSVGNCRPNIDLKSIRAVYKEEVASTNALDDLVPCCPLLAEAGKEPLQGGLDGFVLKGLLNKSECESLIKATESMGFSFWNPSSERKDYRNADTVEVTHQQLADALWLRVKDEVAAEVTILADSPRHSKELEGTWVAVGMNPNMLFNRYFAGGHFSPHTDGYTVLDFNTRSMYSALIYLNDCPVGGATRMMEESGDVLGNHVQEEFVQDEAGRHRFDDARVRASVSPEAGYKSQKSVRVFFVRAAAEDFSPILIARATVNIGT